MSTAFSAGNVYENYQGHLQCLEELEADDAELFADYMTEIFATARYVLLFNNSFHMLIMSLG